ncbi:uncharacterized protein [Prorops nasuta]|uniref:uncharacterized protein isoform X1 n=1 Tax=Prorops nasuta TaxID=863751 RepID=UPI0034CD04D5
MTVNIKFTKFDNTSWGFRLTGGSDFPQPLTVIRVLEGSLAECMGLKVGDIVVRLNDQPISNLTHGQAHEALTLAGNNFVLGIKREEDPQKVVEAIAEENIVPYKIPLDQLRPVFPEKILQETSVVEKLEETEEIAEPVAQSTEEEKEAEEQLSEKPTDDNSEIVPNRNLTDDEIAQLILEEEELLSDKGVLGVNFNKLKPRAPLLKQSKVIAELQHIATAPPDQVEELRRTSVFLQKPQRPVPKPKKQDEAKVAVAQPPETYKVVIKKQPKKSITVRLLEQGLLRPTEARTPEYRSEVKMYVTPPSPPPFDENSTSTQRTHQVFSNDSVHRSDVETSGTPDDSVDNTFIPGDTSENPRDVSVTYFSNDEIYTVDRSDSPQDDSSLEDSVRQLDEPVSNSNDPSILTIEAIDNCYCTVVPNDLVSSTKIGLSKQNDDFDARACLNVSFDIGSDSSISKTVLLVEEESTASRRVGRSFNCSVRKFPVKRNSLDARIPGGRVKLGRFIRGRYSSSCVRWYIASCLCVLNLLTSVLVEGDKGRHQQRRRRSSIIQKGHYFESCVKRQSSCFHEFLQGLMTPFSSGKLCSTRRMRCARARYAERAIVKSIDSVARYIVPSIVAGERKLSSGVHPGKEGGYDRRRRSSVIPKTKGRYMNTCLEQQKTRLVSVMRGLPEMLKTSFARFFWGRSIGSEDSCFRTHYVERFAKEITAIFGSFLIGFYETFVRGKSSGGRYHPSSSLRIDNGHLRLKGRYFESCLGTIYRSFKSAFTSIDSFLSTKIPFVRSIKNSISSEVFHRGSRRLSLADRRRSIRSIEISRSLSWSDRLRNIISVPSGLTLKVNQKDSAVAESICEGKLLENETDRDSRRLSFVPTVLYEGITNRIGIDFTRMVALAFVPCASIILLYVYK